MLSPQKIPQIPQIPQIPISPSPSPSTPITIPPLPLQQDRPHKPSFISQKKTISRFNIMKQIGTGTYCDSFLCMQKKTKGIFCMKKYHKATIKNFPSLLHNFVKKIAFQMLADDPNIVQLYDVFCDDQYVITIEEFMEGGRLVDYLKKEYETKNNTKQTHQQLLLNESRIMDRIYDITSALRNLHSNHPKLPILVHGDIRSRSILTTMGVCKVPSIQPLNTKLQYITEYSPPQFIQSHQFTPKSDIWNLGLVLYELCTFKKLFTDRFAWEDPQRFNSQMHCEIFQINVSDKVDAICGTTFLLKDFIKKMLSLKVQTRPIAAEILSSNVFRMYGLDVEWKQRRNERIIHDKDIKEIGKAHSCIQPNGQYKKIQMFEKYEFIPHKNSSPCTNLSFSRDSNTPFSIEETETEIVPLVKAHWINQKHERQRIRMTSKEKGHMSKQKDKDKDKDRNLSMEKMQNLSMEKMLNLSKEKGKDREKISLKKL